MHDTTMAELMERARRIAAEHMRVTVLLAAAEGAEVDAYNRASRCDGCRCGVHSHV